MVQTPDLAEGSARPGPTLHKEPWHWAGLLQREGPQGGQC